MCATRHTLQPDAPPTRARGAAGRCERWGLWDRRRLPWAGALVVGALLVGQPALADEGLATEATSRYVLDAKATTVEADVTVRLRNVTPDRGSLYYYYNAFTVPVPAGAERVRARGEGAPLDVSLRRTEDPSTRLARISFPNLLYGRSRTIELSFDVPGEKPRSDDAARGPGYATFAVYGVGDSGHNTVEVVAPSSSRSTRRATTSPRTRAARARRTR